VAAAVAMRDAVIGVDDVSPPNAIYNVAWRPSTEFTSNLPQRLHYYLHGKISVQMVDKSEQLLFDQLYYNKFSNNIRTTFNNYFRCQEALDKLDGYTPNLKN
jgi:hypothetical protein